MPIIINADQTVSNADSKGNRCLDDMMADGNVVAVNKLDKLEILAVLSCVKNNPFPLGGGIAYYRAVLKHLQENTPNTDKVTLGKLRQHLVVAAGGGCNAPHDSYLRIAAAIKDGKEYIEDY